MPDEAPTCHECGAPLEGRDVYEGICRTCREDMILAGRRPKARRKSAASLPTKPAPPLPARVSMDEDTKELDALQAPAPAVEEPPGPAPLAAEEKPDTSAEPPVLAFDATPPVAPAALSTAQEDLVPSIVVPSAEEPPQPIAERDAAAQPPLEEAAVEPDTDALDANDEGLLELQLPAVDEEPPRGLSAEQLRLESDRAPSPAPPEAPPPAEAKAAAPPAQAAAGPDELPATSGSLRFVEPAAAAETGALEDFPEEHIRRALDRLGKQVDALAAELERVRAGGRTAGQQVAFGFRLCVGVVLGLGLLGVLVVGGMYAVGKLVHPPTLELLQRALRAISGGP